jgi:ferredoxin--NADP+ reductase
MSSPRPLRVAVIGAGPSGFYAAESLLKGLSAVSVDLFDRLPTPFGLVRYGVAPDHQKIKSVVRLYERTAEDPRCRFFGNVAYGRDLTHDDLKRHYDAVIYAVGASADRSLGIPGEDLCGSMSATEFVAWYNGHPDYVTRLKRITATSVVVVGVGNVAVDVTRILAKSYDELKATDIADHALEVLKDSPVTDIYMLGRRGAAQGKFTTKELRELGELDNADLIIDPAEVAVDADSLKSIEGDTVAQANLKFLQAHAGRPTTGKPRRVHIRFCVSPVELLGDGQVAAVRLETNRLEAANGSIRAVGTGTFETLAAQLVLRSVGYRGEALPGVPFDARRGVIPNIKGVIIDPETKQPRSGEYVAGWIKRGPSGVIGTNKADAMETVQELLAQQGDAQLTEDPDKAPEALTQLLVARQIDYVTFEEWRKLDAAELALGQAQGRPRVKVAMLEAMLKRCKSP